MSLLENLRESHPDATLDDMEGVTYEKDISRLDITDVKLGKFERRLITQHDDLRLSEEQILNASRALLFEWEKKVASIARDCVINGNPTLLGADRDLTERILPVLENPPAPIGTLFGTPVILSPHMTETRHGVRQRPWRERLFSLPWHPGRKTAPFQYDVASDKVLVMKTGFLVMHPNTWDRIQRSLG